mgnify:FL=1
MKKRLILVIALCLTALTACSTNPTSSTQSAQPGQSTSAAQSAEPAAEAKIIKPMSTGNFDPKNPIDMNTAVSFTAANVHKDGDKITLDVTIYEEELFDAVEVTQLKAGDTITAGGKEVKVTKVEELKTGGYAINGGYEQGGVTLFPGDGGTYYQVKENDAKTYVKVGTATLPLSDKFELVDNAENANKKLTAQDMTTLKEDSIGFNENNTTVTVENGVITNITRAYMP